MPYPESCPECGGVFRNTGTHFTARRNEVGRHVLLELGCQNTTRRFWWDFTTGSLTEDGHTIPARRAHNLAAAVGSASMANGSVHPKNNGHVTLSTLDRPEIQVGDEPDEQLAEDLPPAVEVQLEALAEMESEPFEKIELSVDGPADSPLVEQPGQTPAAPASLKDAFVRQLQLDRLTLRQMRSWLMSDEARRAIEVAAGATEATYERLALILFGIDLPQMLGKQPTSAPADSGMSAEERLELQREKARIRARLRRAAAKAARQQV